MSEWEVVSSNNKGRSKLGRKKKEAASQCLDEAGIRRFLATFKTSPCQNTSDHDPRTCKGYHGDPDGNDHRRDPYRDFYDVEDCRNQFETMYHPAIF